MRSLLLISLLSIPRILLAQMDTVWVPWTREYTFGDGIYLSFQDLRRNAPSIPLRAITNELGSPVMDLDDVEGPIFRTNANGTRERFQLDAVWGYCQSGVVHVRAGTGFTRVGLMGSLAHVLYQDVQRIMDPYMMYGSTTYTVETQAFLDMTDGSLLPFTAASLTKVLQRDAFLLEEFNALSKRDRNRPETIFAYMRRYNERHDLLLPDTAP
ncbi:MAG: hypothetical protein IPG10_18745 [Flavobacteriales bacterium]|nr:hypothetical protein [Flavobacteriales bacterium]MBK6755977.1 hypothetical protein [Flavobacteriales bacterium]MBK7270877.1 hypothetical protein [Flavobacteriales bacterium]MBK7752030.1 hypothetical protein [Flavobacteriales bacterium]MBK9073990.1 hypothetical protein [Flavobacteriales bacterium]